MEGNLHQQSLAALGQDSLTTYESSLATMDNRDMDVDMDIDLGPIDTAEVIQPVSMLNETAFLGSRSLHL